MAAGKFDWQGLEAAAVEQMVSAVRAVHQQHPQEQLYAAMFHAFYGDGEVIYWPNIATGSEESLTQRATEYQQMGYKEPLAQLREDLRWSPADLPHNREPDSEGDRWATACCEFAHQSGDGFAQWEKIYQRFLRTFPKAAKKACKQLRQEGITGKTFITFADDESEELIPLSLTKAQILRYFPQFDAAEQERLRLAALPAEQRLAELMPPVMYLAERGPLHDEYEDLLKALGSLALPPLVAVVRREQPGDLCVACRLLAEINLADKTVIAALTELLEDASLEHPSQIPPRCWAASALARLDHMDIITERIPHLPEQVVAQGLGDPYGSFRDMGNHPALDYRPLERALAQHPQIENALTKEFSTALCNITPEEVATAQAALASPWAIIRQHARDVLENFEDEYGKAALPR